MSSPKHFYVFDILFLKYTKIIDLDDVTSESDEDHNKRWPYIPDNPYRMIIIAGSTSGKTNAFLNLIRE